MRIHLISDLHLEFAPFAPCAVDADVVVLAGDTSVGLQGIRWAQAAFPNVPVLYLSGNHEPYGHALPKLIGKLREAANGSRVQVLENDAVVLGDTVFLGCTLWSDFDLFGKAQEDREEAGKLMNDYHRIDLSSSYRRLKPADTAAFHRRSRAWLESRLAEHRGSRKIVVLTHHAPSLRSVPEQYKNDPVSVAFASNLDDLVAQSGAALWVHGHIHTAQDYLIGATRVICNPRGYPDERHTGFVADLVVSI